MDASHKCEQARCVLDFLGLFRIAGSRLHCPTGMYVYLWFRSSCLMLDLTCLAQELLLDALIVTLLLSASVSCCRLRGVCQRLLLPAPWCHGRLHAACATAVSASIFPAVMMWSNVFRNAFCIHYSYLFCRFCIALTLFGDCSLTRFTGSVNVLRSSYFFGYYP